MKQTSKFLESKPRKPPKEAYKECPSRPDKNSEEFIPIFTFLEKIFNSKKERKIQEYEQEYSSAISRWESNTLSVNDYNIGIDQKHDTQLAKWEKEVGEWDKQKETFYNKQSSFNHKIDEMKQKYLENDVDSIVEYCEMVLNNSQYPNSFSQNFELEYNPKNRILIIEYQLPSIDSFPKIKEVKYVAARKELVESYISESQHNKMFDGSMYEITLRTIHEIYEADSVGAIDAVSFNGWVKSINRATGNEENNCILTIQVKKDEFLGINLSR